LMCTLFPGLKPGAIHIMGLSQKVFDKIEC